MSAFANETPTAAMKVEQASTTVSKISLSPPFRLTEEGDVRSTEDGEALLLE